MPFIDRPAPILLAALVLAGPAAAQPTLTGGAVWEAIQRSGLAGTWSEDCSRPASAINPRTTYYRGGDGGAMIKGDFGSAMNALQAPIDTARQVGSARLVLQRQLPGGRTLAEVVEIVGGKMRLVSARLADDAESVRDGRMTSGPRTELPLLQRCGD